MFEPVALVMNNNERILWKILTAKWFFMETSRNIVSSKRRNSHTKHQANLTQLILKDVVT